MDLLIVGGRGDSGAGRSGQPWQVAAVTVDTLRLRDLAGDAAEVSRAASARTR